jgi:hypothetical protein
MDIGEEKIVKRVCEGESWQKRSQSEKKNENKKKTMLKDKFGEPLVFLG